MLSNPKSTSSTVRNSAIASGDEHHSRLGEHAAALWKYKKITDVTVKLNNVSYPAHRTVLSCYSMYFKGLLLDSKENISVITLQMDSVTNEAFSVLLKYMYTADLNVTCQNIGEVHTAARKLGMNGALQICINILTGQIRSEVHSVYVYATAKKLGLTEAAERALQTMCKRFEQIVGTPEFSDLAYDQVIEYLMADELATGSEVVVYLAALKWISAKFLDREEYAADVISCVRFSQMTLNEILACHSPPVLPGIIEMPAIKKHLLEATCFVAAKSVNEEKRFLKYSCRERTYLLPREQKILWDPNIFVPDKHAIYSEDLAAAKIQSAFREYRERKSAQNEDQIQEHIPKMPSKHNRSSSSSLTDNELTADMKKGGDSKENQVSAGEGEKNSSNAKQFTLADKIVNSVTSFFKRPTSIPPDSEDSEKSANSNKKKNIEMTDRDKFRGQPAQMLTLTDKEYENLANERQDETMQSFKNIKTDSTDLDKGGHEKKLDSVPPVRGIDLLEDIEKDGTTLDTKLGFEEELESKLTELNKISEKRQNEFPPEM